MQATTQHSAFDFRASTCERLERELDNFCRLETREFRDLCSAIFSSGNNDAAAASAPLSVQQRQDAVRALLRAFLLKITIVESTQESFYTNRFLSFVRTKMYASNLIPVQPTRPDIEQKHVVCVISAENPSRGFWLFSFATVLNWLAHFFLSSECSNLALYSISQLPSSYVSVFIDSSEENKPYTTRVQKYLLPRLLAPDSPDRSLWWQNSRVLAPNPESLLFYDNNDLIRFFEDQQTQSRYASHLHLKTPTGSATGMDSDPTALSDVTAERLVCTLYLHLGYLLSRDVRPETLESLTRDIRAKNDLLLRILSVAIEMFNGVNISPDETHMMELYKSDVLMVANRAVENVRHALFPIVSPSRSRSSVPMGPPLPPLPQLDQREVLDIRQAKSCYVRTRDMYQATAMLFDLRHRLLIEQSPAKFMQWTYSGVVHVLFSDFVHELDQNTQNLEETALALWLRVEAGRYFSVQLSELLYARRLISLITAPPLEQQQQQSKTPDVSAVRRAAEDTYRHMVECNQKLVVLRFPPNVRYHELVMTFDYLFQLRPDLMHSRLATTTQSTYAALVSEEERMRERDMHRFEPHWVSQTTFVGNDMSGPYVVTFRSQLEIIRQFQLLLALQSPRYFKSMPVFPVLSRFYFGRVLELPLYDPVALFASVESTAVEEEDDDEEEEEDEGDEVDQEQKQPHSPPPPTEDVPLPQTLPVADVNLHATHVVIQTLAYWLRLPTQELALRSVEKGRKRSSAIATAAAAASSFVPVYASSFFASMQYIHKLAAELQRASSIATRSFPSMYDFNALADFIEIHRPRRVRRSVLQRVLEIVQTHYAVSSVSVAAEAEVANPSPQQATQSYHFALGQVVRGLTASLSPTHKGAEQDAPPLVQQQQQHTAPVPDETATLPPNTKKARTAAASSADSQSHTNYPDDNSTEYVSLVLSKLDWTFQGSFRGDPAQYHAMANWLLLYVPIINRILPPELVNELLSETSVCVKGRAPIRAERFAKSPVGADIIHVPQYSAERVSPNVFGEILSNYTLTFITPGMMTQRTLASEFAFQEPMEALARMIMELELLVSPDTWSTVVRKSMAETFDVQQLFTEPPIASSEALDSVVSAASSSSSSARMSADTLGKSLSELRINGRSILPLQIHFNKRDATFAYYETSLALVMLTGTEFARFNGGIAGNNSSILVSDSVFTPTIPSIVGSGSGDGNLGRLLDVMLRFSSRVNLKTAADRKLFCRSLRRFEELVRAREFNRSRSNAAAAAATATTTAVTPTTTLDNNIAHFTSPEELLLFIVHVLFACKSSSIGAKRRRSDRGVVRQSDSAMNTLALWLHERRSVLPPMSARVEEKFFKPVQQRLDQIQPNLYHNAFRGQYFDHLDIDQYGSNDPTASPNSRKHSWKETMNIGSSVEALLGVTYTRDGRIVPIGSGSSSTKAVTRKPQDVEPRANNVAALRTQMLKATSKVV
jgi:hypothetical protein